MTKNFSIELSHFSITDVKIAMHKGFVDVSTHTENRIEIIPDKKTDQKLLPVLEVKGNVVDITHQPFKAMFSSQDKTRFKLLIPENLCLHIELLNGHLRLKGNFEKVSANVKTGIIEVNQEFFKSKSACNLKLMAGDIKITSSESLRMIEKGNRHISYKLSEGSNMLASVGLGDVFVVKK